ncbi:MAG: hypothetical protein AB7S41_10640 [Parvibaculaceae bacterium]
MTRLLCFAGRCGAMVAMILACPAQGAEERVPMPLGAFLCAAIEPAVEHARLVRLPTAEGIRPFVEAQVATGACRVVASEITIVVTDVDKRGFALVDDGQGKSWWTDAENVWGYFDAPAKVKAWRKEP